MLSRRGASEAGGLRLRLALERASATADGAGGATLTWNEIATVAADVIPVRADERDLGEGLGDLTLQKIVIRKRHDVLAGDRFRLGERVFRIRSVSDPTGWTPPVRLREGGHERRTGLQEACRRSSTQMEDMIGGAKIRQRAAKRRGARASRRDGLP